MTQLSFKISFTFFITLFLFKNAIAQSSNESPINLLKTNDPAIRIDGVLDEPFWQTAQKIPLDVETDPGNNLPATISTTLRIAFDDEQFFFSFEAEDPNPNAIRAIISDRDKLDDNDMVSLFIDPFNDSRRAFFFTVNPLGVQQDGVFDELSGDGDLSWDAIWESAGKITKNGFVVEAAIPFKSLRFPNGEGIQTWRFFGARVYARSIEKTFRTMPIDQGNNCILCQANLMTGLQGIRPGRNLEFIPTLTLNRQDENNDFPNEGLEKGDLKTNVGFDARWGITTDLTLNATLNPDFSQVEADAAQLDVNQRFALQFPEKRPFFLEGGDFFNTPLQAFFSRTIANPSYGTKLTGKIKKNAIGLLVARDQINNILLPDFQNSNSISLDQEVDNFVGRFRRDIGRNSNIGFLYTGREAKNYFNRVAGVDVFIRPWNPLTIRGQYLHTETKYAPQVAEEHNLISSPFGGNSFTLNASYDTRHWNSRFKFENRSKGFRVDAGFVPQVDFRRYRFQVERVFWGKEKSWYRKFGWEVGGFRRESTDGLLDMAGTWTSAFINGPLQLNFWINPDINWQQAGGKTFKLFRLWSGFDIQPLGNLGINGWINLGPAVDFANNRKADNLRFKIESDIRIGRHIDMTINHRYLKLHLSGEKILTANVTQWQAAYNINPRTFFKVILQYRYNTRNPELFNDTSVNRIDKSVFAQLLFSYKLNPQSVVFLGYVDNHNGFTDSQNFREVALTQMNQTLFFKIGYAYRP